MAQLILTHGSQFHRALRTRNAFPLSLKVGKFFLLFSLTFMIGVISFFYLLKSTEIDTQGFQLQRLELQRNQLLTSFESKGTGIARFKSLSTVRESDIASSMVPIRNAIYLTKDGNIAQLPHAEGTIRAGRFP